MTSRRARPAVASAAVTLLVACSGSSEADTTSTGAPATVPATSVAAVSTSLPATGAGPAVTAAPATAPGPGMELVSGDGFTLAVPVAWGAYTLAPDGTVEPLDGAAELPAGLGNLAIAAALQGASLLGVAPPAADGRSDTVLVIRLGGEDEPATADVSDALRDRLATEGISDLSLETIEVGGRPAARASFRQVDEVGSEQEVVTVYVPDEESSFVLSFSRPLPATSDLAVIDGIITTFRMA